MQITYYPNLNNNIQSFLVNFPNYFDAPNSIKIIPGNQEVATNDLKLLFLNEYFNYLVTNNIIVLAGVFDSSNPVIPYKTPISDEVTLASGQKPDGTPGFLQLDQSNQLKVAGVSGGSGGDASAANQAIQIIRETEIRDRLPSGGTASEATLVQVRDAIKAQIAIASTVFTDNSGAFYIRRDLINESTGIITVTFTDPTGTVATPGAGLKPLATVDKDIITDFYDVITSGTGYSIGDLLSRIAILDANSSTPTATFIWLNLTAGTILGTAPIAANIERANENVGARQIGNWSMGINNFPSSFQVSNFPSGGSTAAKQPALGIAGTPSPDVLSFQGITNGVPINTATTNVNTTGNITTVDLISTTATSSNNQSIITGNPTANSFVSIAANGYNSFLIQVSGSWTGTFQTEVSFDGGTTWYLGSGFLVGTSYTVSTITTNGAIRGNATDATNIRIRAISAITGTANIRINLSQTVDAVTVRNQIRLFDSTSGSQASIKSANTSAVASDTAIVVTECPSAIAPTLTSITLTTANTEYSITIASAKKLAFKILSGGSIQYAYTTGKVATPTLPYYTLQSGAEEIEELLGKAFTGTLYLASPTAGTIILLKTWS